MDKIQKDFLEYIDDKELIKYYNLDLSIDQLFEKMQNKKFKITTDKKLMPFNAEVKGYKGALDSDGEFWLINKVPDNEVYTHRLCEFVYYLDFMMYTFSCPSILINLEGTYYRAIKLIKNAVNISSYNYIDEPYRTELARDLINRWLYFDEDRNPNNYMVIQNLKKKQLVIAIDFDHSDFDAEEMKVTGDENRFGWFRKEKTRYLTLLRPENFEKMTISIFENRLQAMMALDKEKLISMLKILLKNIVQNEEKRAKKIVKNLIKRREYINSYFRKWFKDKPAEPKDEKDSSYSIFGKSFIDSYKE